MIYTIPLNRITPNPWQTRQGTNPEAIRELALDIEANGLLQTPRGRLVFVSDGAPVDWDAKNLAERLVYDNTSIQLAFGHNRLEAFRWLRDSQRPGDWSAMPVDIFHLRDEEMAVLAWSENERRREHTPLERALAIQTRMLYFKWNQDQVAEKLGISRPVVTNALRLLRLPQNVQDEVQACRLTERQAQALIPLYDADPEMAAAHGFAATVDLIVSKAVAGESSERLREDVSEAVAWLKGQVQPGLIESTQVVGHQLDPRIYGKPPEPEPPKWEPQSTQPPEEPQDDDFEALVEKATEFVRNQRRASVSFLQRYFKIGYTHAVRLIDRLYELGVIGPDKGDGEREIIGAAAAAPTEEPPAPVPTSEHKEPINLQQFNAAVKAQEAANTAHKPQPPAPVAQPEPEPEPEPAPATVEASTIDLTISLWPQDDSGSRMVIVSGRINNGPPIIRMLRDADIQFPPVVAEIIDQLKDKGPNQ